MTKGAVCYLFWKTEEQTVLNLALWEWCWYPMLSFYLQERHELRLKKAREHVQYGNMFMDTCRTVKKGPRCHRVGGVCTMAHVCSSS